MANLSATGQKVTMTVSPLVQNSMLKVNNPVIGKDGRNIVPSFISNTGIYDEATGLVMWKNLSLTKTTIRFEENGFSGTVTMNLEV